MQIMRNGQPKTKYWATICYDEDIITLDYYLKRFHMPIIVSPLHDNDYCDGVEDISYYEDDVCYWAIHKKPHRHIMWVFDNDVSKKSFQYLLEHKLCYSLYRHCAGREPVENLNGMSRYFIHLDNPEKAQYEREDIVYYGGLNDSLLEPPKMDKRLKVSNLRKYIELIMHYDIQDITSLLEFAMDNMSDEDVNFIIVNSRQLEVFTRGQFQKGERLNRSLRQKAVNGYH